ncbi:MAG: hypothetical protein IH991_11340, partial [Planctomycetes bacterium]|nr:hypothetical protein [Planctomycetota bacterium]
MNMSKLVFREIVTRPANFLLCVLAVVTAAALFIAGPTLISGYAEDTKVEINRLEKDARKLEHQASRLEGDARDLLKKADGLQ